MTLLSKLKEYADERLEDQLPPLYANTPVAWIIVLDSNGCVLSPQPISRIDPSTTRGKGGLDMAAPEVQRAAGIKPLLLADNGEYTFGRARDPAKQERVDQAHAEYRQLLDRCAIETEEPAVLAVKRFYERGGADQLTLGEEWDYGLKVTFEVTGRDLEEAQQAIQAIAGGGVAKTEVPPVQGRTSHATMSPSGSDGYDHDRSAARDRAIDCR